MTFESFRSRGSERKRDGGQVAAPVETTSAAVVVEFMVVTCWEVKGQFLKQPCRVRSGTKTLGGSIEYFLRLLVGNSTRRKGKKKKQTKPPERKKSTRRTSG